MQGVKELRICNFGPYYFREVKFDETGEVIKNVGVDAKDSYSNNSLTKDSIEFIINNFLDGLYMLEANKTCSKWVHPKIRGIKNYTSHKGFLMIKLYSKNQDDLGFIVEFDNNLSSSNVTCYLGDDSYFFSLSEYTQEIHQYIVNQIYTEIK